jgi:hypothetical protein
MKSERVAAFGCPHPRCTLTGEGDLSAEVQQANVTGFADDAQNFLHFSWCDRRRRDCCKACLDRYLSDTTREAYRSKRWLDFLARKY